MNSDERQPTDLQDRQLRTVVTYIARLCLEVERGLRPPDHLRQLTDPRANGLVRRRINVGNFTGGPVRRQDIGPPQLSRLTDEHAIATVVTRTEGNRWGALTIGLRAEQGRWYVVDLKRVLASRHYRTGPDQTVDRQPSPEETIRSVTAEQRLVEAAYRATRRRLDDFAPRTKGRSEMKRQVERWQRRMAELDVELAALRRRRLTGRGEPSDRSIRGR
jgi:hypothetical protein